MHGCMRIFCGECGMHSDKCSEHHARAGFYVEQVLCASGYTFANTLATGSHAKFTEDLKKLFQSHPKDFAVRQNWLRFLLK